MQTSQKRKGVALVTGATGIIGPAICEALRRDGWRVAACASSKKSFSYYAKVFPKPLVADGKFIADLHGRAACHSLVCQIERELGPVVVLVNNAVTNPNPVTLHEMTEEYAHRMVEVDLLAPLWLTQAAEKSLVAQRGCVVNISSVEVKRLSPEVAMYPTLKAALEKLTSALALELGPKGVRVNCIRVGSVPGPAFLRDILTKLPRDKARRLYAEIEPKHRTAKSWMSATDRAGAPTDIAEAVAFLASPRAEFFNGATLPLEGGITHRWDITKPATDWDSQKAVREWLSKEGVKL
jgi:NAD(P)-dependent dehydrogenase (short-subunit alcohol dehydrogenase family)